MKIGIDDQFVHVIPETSKFELIARTLKNGSSLWLIPLPQPDPAVMALKAF